MEGDMLQPSENSPALVLLVSRTGKIPKSDKLVQKIVQSHIEVRKDLIELLQRYDGSTSAFQSVVVDVLTRQGFSQTQLAKICATSTGSISRWVRGAMPTRLARLAACERIRAVLALQIGELNQILPLLGE
jgi:hypothetical protein